MIYKIYLVYKYNADAWEMKVKEQAIEKIVKIK